MYLEFDSLVVRRFKIWSKTQYSFQFLFQRPLSVPCHGTVVSSSSAYEPDSFLGKTWYPLALLSQSANAERILIRWDHHYGLTYVLKSANSWKQRLRYFSKCFFHEFSIFLTSIRNNWQVMKYLVLPPSCFGEAEFRTRLKLNLHNNACAVIRDTKTKNRAETSTRCLTARVIMIYWTLHPCLLNDTECTYWKYIVDSLSISTLLNFAKFRQPYLAQRVLKCIPASASLLGNGVLLPNVPKFLLFRKISIVLPTARFSDDSDSKVSAIFLTVLADVDGAWAKKTKVTHVQWCSAE